MKVLKWILCILIFAICVACSLYFGTALIDGIVAGLVLGGFVFFLFRTIIALKSKNWLTT